jgi:hypothetical protein
MAAFRQPQLSTQRKRYLSEAKKTASGIYIAKKIRIPAKPYRYPSQLLTNTDISKSSDDSYYQACRKLSLQLAKTLSAKRALDESSVTH